MDIRFVEIIKSFFPKGKIWEFQQNFIYLINGMSVEFGRMYDTAKALYQNINIITSTVYATTHSKDYLIEQNLFTDTELQRIIVEYLNKGLGFKATISDFATFINMTLSFGAVPDSFIVGSNTAGNALGDAGFTNTNMILYVVFSTIETPEDQENIIKIKWLIEYIKPPYIEVIYNDTTTFIEYSFTDILTV